MEAITLDSNIPDILPVATQPAQTQPELSAEDLEIAAMFLATKKKKKKPKADEPKADEPKADEPKADEPKADEPKAESSAVSNSLFPHEEDDSEEQTYDQMLSLIYMKMGAVYSASELALKRLQRPKMAMIGSKRVGWINFGKTAATLNRSQEHLSSFIEAEFGTTISIDAKNCLVIKGRFSAEQIESVLKKYVEQYIKCRTCKSMETELIRDPNSRLFFLKCETCLSQWSVAVIQKGFHATMKGERKAARAAE